MEKRPVVSTMFLWLLVMLAAVAVLAHTTPTGRHVLRATIPLHLGR
jgi:hypothetical protein